MGLSKIFGGKKKAHTPIEAKESGRSKQFVRIVEVISEGEIQGLVAGEQSVFLDNTPLKNADGSYNFQNVMADGEAGTQDQAVMKGFDSSEKEISVGTEVRKRTPLTRTVTDPNVSRLRLTLGVSSLFEQAENGDTNGSQVDFVIRIGSQTHNLSINGKYSSQYLRSLIIDNLPPVPFQIRVERVQADSTSQRLQNKTLWASYTEIIDTPFAYPNTALVGIKFDSEYFSQIPTRSYDIFGIKVQVPSNYNPTTRTYSGLWDGTFKKAYSNNPVWVLMDIVTHKRYGLGRRLGEFGVDKWAFYQAAQYCDQMIPDGFGGTEPRFTCNVWLTEQRAAYDVINDICSIFRATPVWNGTELTVIMDRPSDPVWTYTNANVINGEFSRQYSAVKARHNAIQVEYQDASNNYEKAIEYLSDDAAIHKHGLNLKKVVAFGCTSRGQAYRTGRWILETERLETETITFSVGAEGLMHIPGDIIRVSDNHYAGTAIGGRVVAISGRTVTLDREIQPSGNSVFSFINAEAKHSHIRIQSVSGKTITLDRTPTGLTENGVWSLSTQQITSRLYRAMTIAENDGSYTITALQHEPHKEAIVDNGAVFEPIATSVHRPPQIEHLNVDLAGSNATFNWQSTTGEGVVTYDVRVLKGEKLYAFHKGLTELALALDDLPNGDYAVIILAKNARGQILSEKRKTFTVDRPPVPKNVQVVGGLSDISLSWDYVDDFTQTEIWASPTNDIRMAKRVAKVLASFYSHAVGARQTRYYWLRHIRGQNVGQFHQQQGIQGQSGADIDEEIRLLNEKLSQPIINQVFDVAAPARGLELVKTVPNLTNRRAYQNAKLVFNSADNKLYTWNGTEYTQKVAVENLEGQIPTNKLTGQLQDAQIQSLNVGKLSGNIPKSRLDPSLIADVNKAKADINTEREARTTAVNAVARQASALTTRLDGAEATVRQQSQTLATLNGTVQSMHTISTQTISGNRKAIAGISLGSAGGTTSNIILMADSTQFVKNAQDGSPKTLMTVADGKLALNGDLLANGTVQAEHLGANSVTTGAIQAGAVRANHIAAAEISADKLAIGLGGNLLYNPIFANIGRDGLPDGCGKWLDSSATNFRSSTGQLNDIWGLKSYLPNENQIAVFIDGNNRASATVSMQDVPVNEGAWYMLSAYIGVHRCHSRITARCIKADGTRQDFSSEIVDTRYSFNGGLAGTAKRAFVKFRVPAGTVKLGVLFWILPIGNEPNKHLRVARPMLEECTEHTREPSPWQNAGVTSIHGGSIVTDTITARQIAAGSITTAHMVAGQIDASVLKAETIRANHIHPNSITARLLNVQTLSAISSNIGSITAGTISGTAINGATIRGGTISGVHISGVTGRFTGELEVTKLIGSVAVEHVVANLRHTATISKSFSYEVDVRRGDGTHSPETRTEHYTVRKYTATISIGRQPFERYITIEGEASFILAANQTKTVNIERFGGRDNAPPVGGTSVLVTAYATTQHSNSIRVS